MRGTHSLENGLLAAKRRDYAIYLCAVRIQLVYLYLKIVLDNIAQAHTRSGLYLLISIWAEASIQQELDGAVRNKSTLEKLPIIYMKLVSTRTECSVGQS